MNSEGFLDGDGVDSMKNPETGTVYKPGDKCPICGEWGVDTTLIELSNKRRPEWGYCPRQVIHRYSSYKGIPEMDEIVKRCREIIAEHEKQ